MKEYSESTFQPLIQRIVVRPTTNLPLPSSRWCHRACRKKSRIAVPHTIRLSRGIPLPLPLPLSPRSGEPLTPPLPRRALEQSMEIITLMASPTRECGTTRTPPLPSSLARKASLEWERSRHLDGNVTLPAPPSAAARIVQNGALAPSRAERRERTRASFLRYNGVMPFSTR